MLLSGPQPAFAQQRQLFTSSQPIPSEFAVERGAVDSQLGGSGHDVPIGFSQRLTSIGMGRSAPTRTNLSAWDGLISHRRLFSPTRLSLR